MGVRANSGAANFTATIKLGEEPEQPADPNDEDGALVISAINFGQGLLDSQRATGPRFVRLEFDSFATAMHTITVSWDSGADVRFNVLDSDGNRLNDSVVLESNPGIWTGELEACLLYTSPSPRDRG